MKAVIFCADFAFAARARSILLRVGRRSDVDVRWTVKAWPIVVLDDAALSERIRLEVKDARLIVISSDHARSLPLHLRNWLEQWATDRRTEEAAVGVIDESAHSVSETEDFSELKPLLDKHGLSLITSQTHTANYPAKISPIFSKEPERLLPLRRTHFPNVSHRGGLNMQARHMTLKTFRSSTKLNQ